MKAKINPLYTEEPHVTQFEKLDVNDLAVLDTESPTSVVEFMQIFQSDATFTPPTMEVMYDSDHVSLDIDSDGELDSIFFDTVDFTSEEINNAREKLKTRAKNNMDNK